MAEETTGIRISFRCRGGWLGINQELEAGGFHGLVQQPQHFMGRYTPGIHDVVNSKRGVGISHFQASTDAIINMGEGVNATGEFCALV